MNKFNNQILNTPFEISLRLLLILSENSSCKFDVERLSYYDYIAVNLGDYSNEYESLHPKSPYRKGEIAIKRPLVKAALLILIKKDLIKVNFTIEGFYFSVNDYSNMFIEQIKSEYAKDLKKQIEITSTLLKNKTNYEIKVFFDTFIKIHEIEFNNEAIVRGV